MKVRDGTRSPKELVADGIPLVGDNWLGAARISGAEIIMDVYTSSGITSLDDCEAYCPLWSDGFHDTDLAGRVQVSTLSGGRR